MICKDRETKFPHHGSKEIGKGLVEPLQTEMKVKLYESLQDSGIRKSDLARKMKLHRQEIERLLDFKQSTSLAKIESAFAALGKRINLEVAEFD